MKVSRKAGEPRGDRSIRFAGRGRTGVEQIREISDHSPPAIHVAQRGDSGQKVFFLRPTTPPIETDCPSGARGGHGALGLAAHTQSRPSRSRPRYELAMPMSSV
jgi:hypothetical protein